MDDMIERVKAAIGAETHIWQRVDKFQPLPFQVIDRTGEPIVLSSWATAAAAEAAWLNADSEKRARAAIAAMREPTQEMRIWAVDALGNVKRGMAEHLRGAGGEKAFAAMLMADSGQTDAVWRASIDAALGPAQDETARKETG